MFGKVDPVVVTAGTLTKLLSMLVDQHPAVGIECDAGAVCRQVAGQEYAGAAGSNNYAMCKWHLASPSFLMEC